MNRKDIREIKDGLTEVTVSSDETCKLTRKLIRRVEHLTFQQELTNNILIEMIRADSREDLNNRLDLLLCTDEA